MNKRHSPSRRFGMTDECALPACTTNISVWRGNKQKVRHNRVGQANRLVSIGVSADFMRSVLGALASATVHLLEHIEHFAVSLAG